MFEYLLIADSSGFFLGLLGVILFLISVFLIFIILIQRGKGGGIAGSLTGTAQSAFGARGGDILMWLTLSLTIIWILLCCVTIFFYSRVQDSVAEGREDADIQTDITSPNPENALPTGKSVDDAGGGGTTGETPPAISPTTDTDDSVGTDKTGTETEPESANAPDNEQQSTDTTSGDKE
jgi:preprotein translocase subunit SecG